MTPDKPSAELLADELDGLAELLSKENTGSDAGFDNICKRAAVFLRASPPPVMPSMEREKIARKIPEHIFMDQGFDECDDMEKKAFLRCADAILSLLEQPAEKKI